MDEVIQYRKDQKAGGGRLVYKGVKLNNRTMHNFRPTIGTVHTFGINKQLMAVTVIKSVSKIENMFSFLQDSLSQHTTSALLPVLRDQLKDHKTSFLWQNTNLYFLFFFNKCKLFFSSQFESINNIRNDVF